MAEYLSATIGQPGAQLTLHWLIGQGYRFALTHPTFPHPESWHPVRRPHLFIAALTRTVDGGLGTRVFGTPERHAGEFITSGAQPILQWGLWAGVPVNIPIVATTEELANLLRVVNEIWPKSRK